MADQQYCLRWNNHQNTLISVFDSLQERGCMVDCTLGAEGQSLQAHKVVLSACSPYLEDLLTKHYDKHPILILKDVRFEELKAMVDYMYRGEVNVAHDKLNLFLRAAESLQIKGLSDSGTDPPDTGGTAGGTKRTSKGAPVSVRSNQQLTVRSTNLADDSRDGSVSPSQRKRRRRRGSDESDNDSSSNVADGKQSSAAAAPVTGPSVLNQDLLPTVPASVPADALLSSIMESAETDTATDSGLYANAVTPSSQENVILDKGSSDVLVQPKTEYLDDDTQDLALGDDDSVAGPSHSRSGNFMNDTDMFMADQDGSNNAQGVQRRNNCSKCKKCGGRTSRENLRRASRTGNIFGCIQRSGDRLRELRATTAAPHKAPDVRTIEAEGGPTPEDQNEIDVPDHLVQECLDSIAAEDSGLGLQRQIVSSGSSLVDGLDVPASLPRSVSWTPADDQPLQADQPKPAAAPLATQELLRPPSWPSSSVRLKSILRRSVAPVPQSRGSPAPPEASHPQAARGSAAPQKHQSRVAQAAPSSAAALATNEGARGVGASSPSGSDTARKPRPRKSRSPPGSRAALATRLTATVPVVEDNRELRCTDCNILFESGKMLVAHLRTHNKERPFKCDQCEATFTEGWTLKYHKFRHTGLKPFQCPVCSRKFRTRDALRQHVAGQHTNEARHACPHCEKKFRYRAEFHRHKALLHGALK